MLKKIVSVIASLIISASAVAGGLRNNTATAFDLGGLIESQIDRHRTIIPSRGNMVNFTCVDSNGAVMEYYSATIRNSAGQEVGVFTKSFSGGYESYCKPEGIITSITDNPEWEVPMKTFGDLVAPQVPVMACDYTVSPRPGASVSYGIYEKYNPNVNVLLSGNIESSECEQMKILATNAGETTAFTIPAGKAGIFVDQKWASRDGEGFYFIGDTSKKYYSKKEMIGNLKKISPDSLEYFSIGLEDILSWDLRLDHTPEYQSNTTEYVKCTMSLSDIFKGTSFPVFNSDGTFTWNEKSFDLRQDKKYTSCILTIVSGACVTVAMPDSSGNVEFYVEKESRKFKAEISLCYKNSKNGNYNYGNIDDTWLYGGTEYIINIGVPNIPRTGETIYEVPAGKYSLEFTSLPKGYINPGVVTFDVANSNAIQYKKVSIQSAPQIALGDVNGSGTIDSSDASSILEFYARQSIGSTALFTIEQEVAADVNNDFRVDASDASCILGYYAYVSTGGKISLKDYAKS